jgi:hypothetical protein
MDLKNAAAVCLIALFSATLVVLIARSLDNQAASRLEPKLAAIAEELRAIRGQGGLAAAPEGSGDIATVRDGLVVYYFHSNTRCPTCQSIESQAQAVVQKDFASQLGKGEVVWKIVNYEQASAKPLADKFAIQMPVVVLVRMKNGEIEDWRRLDKVWAFESDKPAFAKYVRAEIDQMLAAEKKAASTAAQTSSPAIPLPNAESEPAKEAPAIPIP